jgi:hypothetical protein
MKSLQIVMVITAGCISSAAALAETTACTPITALPASISASGIYCLRTDLMTSISSGSAIEITANFVTLDLNGWRLGGGGAGMGTNAKGVHALDRRGITIRNGNIKGFLLGVYLESNGASTSHLIEDIRADGNTKFGIYVEGGNSIIRNNQVSNTGGSTSGGGMNAAYGIASWGSGNQILNNGVSATKASLGSSVAYGIDSGYPDTLIAGNRVFDTESTQSDAIGIHAGQGNIVADNQVVGSNGPHQIGIRTGSGATVSNNLVYGYATGVSMSGTYSGNVVVGATTPYSSGIAHGSTNAP